MVLGSSSITTINTGTYPSGFLFFLPGFYLIFLASTYDLPKRVGLYWFRAYRIHKHGWSEYRRNVPLQSKGNQPLISSTVLGARRSSLLS